MGWGARSAFQTETRRAGKPITGRSAFQGGPTAPSNGLAGAVRRLFGGYWETLKLTSFEEPLVFDPLFDWMRA
jgi:hypothetical protein